MPIDGGEKDIEDKQKLLFERLDTNFAMFHTQWEAQSKKEFIGNSGEITAIKDAYHYLTESHGFESEEVDYLLLFENPLEVVADKWKERAEDLSDFTFTLDEVFDKRDALRDYPLKEKPSVLEKLKGVSSLVPKPHVTGKEQEVR